MSWLEERYLVQTNGPGKLRVAAIASEGILGVDESNGAIVFVDLPNLKDWTVEGYPKAPPHVL